MADVEIEEIGESGEKTFIPREPLRLRPQGKAGTGKRVAAGVGDNKWILQLGIDNYRVLAPDRFGETEGPVPYGESCILTVTSGKYAGRIVAAWVDDPEVVEEHIVYLITGRLPVATEDVTFDFEEENEEGEDITVTGVEAIEGAVEGAVSMEPEEEDDADYEPLEPGADPAVIPVTEPEIDKIPTE